MTRQVLLFHSDLEAKWADKTFLPELLLVSLKSVMILEASPNFLIQHNAMMIMRKRMEH